jgi:hypothetical protein
MRLPIPQIFMENNKGGENLQGPKPETPRLVFPIAGKVVNIADALSGDWQRNKGLKSRDIRNEAGSTPEKFKPGDDYALYWLTAFQQAEVNDKLYLKRIPKFFEWAAKPKVDLMRVFLPCQSRSLIRQ